MNRSIYVASSWRNSLQPSVVALLRELGHKVYDFRNPSWQEGASTNGFHWSEIDPNWQQWTPTQYRLALQNPIADRGYRSDLRGMEWADTCVLVLPCGRSAHAEAGWMAGANKEVYVLITEPTEPELMYRLLAGVLASIDELRDEFAIPEFETTPT